MTNGRRETIVAEWIQAANTHDPERFLAFFADDAVLDDPSVGRSFEGADGIGEYYRDYFIGYGTRTRLIGMTPQDGHLHVEVHFTGEFPGGQTGGIFDITFTGDQIRFIRADLA
ncbi:nuclear transport factor 2 family protein [Kineosporia sp. J2-2]|uniref:Nuclear transport factor 2 family protein n=1 Tax=Kineosporia corallincola TaxID=2835133 RepID=A0ABS5TDC6_9ACTN|nr:nuclear transport factor 2 family protein [Kineosporia corallincola]MBT0769082.1 nuclear transport factor 2 family protein [Kineosporia corallincola]